MAARGLSPPAPTSCFTCSLIGTALEPRQRSTVEGADSMGGEFSALIALVFVARDQDFTPGRPSTRTPRGTPRAMVVVASRRHDRALRQYDVVRLPSTCEWARRTRQGALAWPPEARSSCSAASPSGSGRSCPIAVIGVWSGQLCCRSPLAAHLGRECHAAAAEHRAAWARTRWHRSRSARQGRSFSSNGNPTRRYTADECWRISGRTRPSR